jgi:SAM-dependent methyltransferase
VAEPSRRIEITKEIRRRFWRATMFHLKKGPHLSRYAMYQRLSEVGEALQIDSGRALSISHSVHLLQLLGVSPTALIEANYPEYSITSLPFDDAEFDIVVSDQVLEHVKGNPFTAISETRRVLKAGGLAVHTSVFMYPMHGPTTDFWRYTPAALRLLCSEFSEIVECGGWGSFDAWRWVQNGMMFEPVPHATWHPLHKVATRNEPTWPMVTWIVARK